MVKQHFAHHENGIRIGQSGMLCQVDCRPGTKPTPRVVSMDVYWLQDGALSRTLQPAYRADPGGGLRCGVCRRTVQVCLAIRMGLNLADSAHKFPCRIALVCFFWINNLRASGKKVPGICQKITTIVLIRYLNSGWSVHKRSMMDAGTKGYCGYTHWVAIEIGFSRAYITARTWQKCS